MAISPRSACRCCNRLTAGRLPQPLSVCWFVVALGYPVWQLWSLGGFSRESGGIGWLGGGRLIRVAGPSSIGLGLACGTAWRSGDSPASALAAHRLRGLVPARRCAPPRHGWHDRGGDRTEPDGEPDELRNWTPQQNIPLQFSLVAWMLLAVIAAPIMIAALARPGNERPRGAWARAGLALAWVVVIVYPGRGQCGLPGARVPATDGRSPRRDSRHARFVGLHGGSGSLAVDANGGMVAPYRPRHRSRRD